MASVVNFNAADRIIEITLAPDINGFVTIDINRDIYSDGKEDWLSNSTLNKLRFPISVIGGDPITDSRKLGATFFINYGWKIKPYEADHTLIIVGNVYTDDGSTPFIQTDGTYNVSIQREVSSIIDGVASAAQIASEVWDGQWQPYVQDSTKNPTFGSRLGKKTQFGLFGK